MFSLRAQKVLLNGDFTTLQKILPRWSLVSAGVEGRSWLWLPKGVINLQGHRRAGVH